MLKPALPEPGNGANRGLAIQVAPLPDAASRQLAQELLQRADGVPDKVIDLLVERSEGMPYYVEEMVNWFLDRGILDAHGERWTFLPEKLKEEPLPATLQHLLLTRLSGLSQDERAALQRGAIFGRHFWTGGLEALGVQHGAQMLGVLQPRGFVEAQPESTFQGDTEWSFHHNLLQEVTYESVLKRERATLHKVAAGWLERQAGRAGRLDEFAGLLGEHYERAGEISIAADWYLQAGRRAYGQGAPRESAGFYRRAIELLPPVDRQRRWQALLGLEEALSVPAEADPLKVVINDIMELARTLDDENALAEAYLRQTQFGTRTGDLNISQAACQAGLEVARRCGNERLEAKFLSHAADVALSTGDKTACLRDIEQALQLARSLGDESILAYVLYRAAYCYSGLGDTVMADSLQHEQIGLDHRLGNRLMELLGLGNMASGYLGLGLYKQARAALEQACQIATSLGAHRALAYDLLNLGEIYRVSGDLRKARQLAEQASQEIAPSQDVRGKYFAAGELGYVLLTMGDTPGAARRFIEARQNALDHGLSALACEPTAGLAACAIQQGQLDEAHIYVNEAWNYLKEHGWVGLNIPGAVYRICAETFDALGEEENVRAVLESAHQALMDVLEKITIPEWRQSFLENVPDHRALMEMWERRK
jgi:tetratricopeptide (TPR) repeat protein